MRRKMSIIEKLENEIKGLENRKIELLKELEIEKQKTEIEYPFHFKGECWKLRLDGLVEEDWWSNSGYDRNCYQQGNMFTTQQEAIKECDRRILLTRFRQFRDKCNGDWKPDWEGWEANKYYLAYSYLSDTVCCFVALLNTAFQPFGYFKNRTDCQRAIELFGDEIKRLWVEEE